jgi:DNA mismatch repair protein MutL
LITLLPDHVANQIAAGEVVQRPASAVKELLENAIDSKASDIKLIIKDSGKTLIQVIDNGTGMNEVDARMCFERHATSKIKSADDLFEIQTMGFRGEAIAAIDAIASPLNPIVCISNKSSADLIFDVAWRSKHILTSVSLIPHPLSTTCKSVFPASFTNNFISDPPASNAFSSISFTADAGL